MIPAARRVLGFYPPTSDIEHRILLELKYMGVRKEDIRIFGSGRRGEPVTINFQWAYPEQELKGYSITYIQADIRRSEECLRKILDRGVDIYYQRASGDTPLHYDKYIPAIAGSIREGGYMLTDDIAFGKHAEHIDFSDSLDELVSLSFTRKGKISSEELRRWEDLILGTVSRRYMRYGRLINIRQRKIILPRPERMDIDKADSSNTPAAEPLKAPFFTDFFVQG